jgi:hypothetical protein
MVKEEDRVDLSVLLKNLQWFDGRENIKWLFGE